MAKPLLFTPAPIKAKAMDLLRQLNIPATRLRALQFSQLFDQDNTADHIEATFALEGLLSEWSEAGASVESQDAVMNAAFAIARRRSVTPSSTTAVQLVVSAARELMKALAAKSVNQHGQHGKAMEAMYDATVRAGIADEFLRSSGFSPPKQDGEDPGQPLAEISPIPRAPRDPGFGGQVRPRTDEQSLKCPSPPFRGAQG